MNPLIINNDLNDEYYFEEGCYILELSNSDKDKDVSIARARVAPQTSTEPHRLLGTIERYVILSGEGEVTLANNLPQSVSANDVVIIPENCCQHIRNTGEDDLIFLAICSPRFQKDHYHGG